VHLYSVDQENSVITRKILYIRRSKGRRSSWSHRDLHSSANGRYLETNLREVSSVKQETTIKDEGRLHHVVIYLLPVENDKVFPLGSNDDCLRFVASVDCGLSNLDLLLNYGQNFSSRPWRDANLMTMS
jgi:hypothetical protein